ncbi:MAG: hypothetical protein M3179_12975, partial [Actinomycetota bacterium]|nr:hypothetical protein [Actinomycetota bacterium]
MSGPPRFPLEPRALYGEAVTAALAEKQQLHPGRELVYIVCEGHRYRDNFLAVVTRCSKGLLFHEQRIADRDDVVRARRMPGEPGREFIYETAMLLDWPALANVDGRTPQVSCSHGTFRLSVDDLIT